MNESGRGEDGVRAPRPSIEERAARRDRIEAAPGDRYRNLLRALRAGREVPLDRDSRMEWGWHPILWKLLAVIAAGVVLYAGLRIGGDWLRQQRVDTWSGPDAAVQSGQQLATCPGVSAYDDDVFPNWVRIGTRVYTLSDAIRPVPRPGVGETTYAESGYSLGSLRLLYDDATPQGLERGYVLVYGPPALAARVYRAVAGCQ